MSLLLMTLGIVVDEVVTVASVPQSPVRVRMAVNTTADSSVQIIIRRFGEMDITATIGF